MSRGFECDDMETAAGDGCNSEGPEDEDPHWWLGEPGSECVGRASSKRWAESQTHTHKQTHTFAPYPTRPALLYRREVAGLEAIALRRRGGRRAYGLSIQLLGELHASPPTGYPCRGVPWGKIPTNSKKRLFFLFPWKHLQSSATESLADTGQWTGLLGQGRTWRPATSRRQLCSMQAQMKCHLQRGEQRRCCWQRRAGHAAAGQRTRTSVQPLSCETRACVCFGFGSGFRVQGLGFRV